MAHFGPKAVLTSIVNDWGPHYIQATQSELDHSWKSQDYWGGLKEGTVELPISDLVPAPVKAEAEQIIADIKSGAFHPFTGPIKDQAGVEKFAPGAMASNADLASMNYYVEGMKADIPK
jgi:simple sugar transport system substrate-binding protein